MARVRLSNNSVYTDADVDNYANLWAEHARKSYWVFRQLMHPKLIHGWWQKEVAAHLQRFYEQYKRNERPKMLLQSPPQHGKSEQIVDFVAWAAGQDPEDRVIYASFSDRLGVRANLRLQRIYDSRVYRQIFPNTRISLDNVVTRAGRRLRNREIIEYIGTAEGYFRNTTVGGPVTGEGLDIGVIDDPLKGRAEASSPTIRDKTWDWFTDDFLTRFSDKGALLCIMTRWHLDDPGGRMITTFPNLTHLRYPALAERDERRRNKGEPLFPELKSLEFLESQRSSMTQAGWESVFQQNPIVVGGGIFPVDKFRVVSQKDAPVQADIRQSVRYWDKAGTHEDGAYTAGVLMHQLKDGRFYIEHVYRKQVEAWDRERDMKRIAEMDNSDGRRVQIWVEQEPGSGGKESAQRSVVNLAGFEIFRDRVRGNKEFRAEPYAAQVQGGNVMLLAGKWNQDFLDEHEAFPNGKYKDQVDAATGAFSRLVSPRLQPATGVGAPVGFEGDKRIDRLPTQAPASPVSYISTASRT